MTSTFTIDSKLTWSEKAYFADALLSASEYNELLGTTLSTNEPIRLSYVSVDKARFKYKKQVADSISDGFLSGSVYVGISELNWEWDPEFEIDGTPVETSDIEDYLDDLASAIMDGAEKGEIQVPVEYTIDLTVTAQSGCLAMGEVTVDNVLGLFEMCNFATDGEDVIFDGEMDTPRMAEIKSEIIRMVEGWK